MLDAAKRQAKWAMTGVLCLFGFLFVCCLYLFSR